MKFLIDANLPRALAQWLVSDEDEAFYVDDLLKPPATDNDIWAHASAGNFIIISKDADFAARAVRDGSVRIVWVRCGNLKLNVFEAWIAARRANMLRSLEEGEHLIELR
ncbi:MAG: DUF5615 family PIN-like protein [Caulobacterales bacterium]